MYTVYDAGFVRITRLVSYERNTAALGVAHAICVTKITIMRIRLILRCGHERLITVYVCIGEKETEHGR